MKYFPHSCRLEGIQVKSFLFPHDSKKHVVGNHQKCFSEALLMNTHNMFSQRNNKNIDMVWLNKAPNLELCIQLVIYLEVIYVIFLWKIVYMLYFQFWFNLQFRAWAFKASVAKKEIDALFRGGCKGVILSIFWPFSESGYTLQRANSFLFRVDPFSEGDWFIGKQTWSYKIKSPSAQHLCWTCLHKKSYVLINCTQKSCSRFYTLPYYSGKVLWYHVGCLSYICISISGL